MNIQDRRTPQWLFGSLQSFFGVEFLLDAAATKQNSMAHLSWTEEDNGLFQQWSPMTFCNPPFRRFGDWMQKAAEEGVCGQSSVLIGPMGCSQGWFHLEAQHNAVIYAPDARISFLLPDGTWPVDKDGKKTGADRDHMLYCFGPHFAKSKTGFDIRAFPARAYMDRWRRENGELS